MSFDFAKLKAEVRQVVHDTLAVPCLYHGADDFDEVGPGMPVEPPELRIRWHTKIDRFGDIDDVGYAELIEGVNRVIFNRPQLAEKGVVLHAGDEIEMTSPQFQGTWLVLVAREPHDGPTEEVWTVVMK